MRVRQRFCTPGLVVPNAKCSELAADEIALPASGLSLGLSDGRKGRLTSQILVRSDV